MNDIANTRKKLKQIAEGSLGDMANRCETDHEVQMARADLYKIGKYAIELHDMLRNVSEEQGLEGWVQSKITKAADYMGSVKHHLEYEMSGMNSDNQEAMPADALDALESTEADQNKKNMKAESKFSDWSKK